MTPGYRADHIGRRLRPPAGLLARAAHTAGRLPADDPRTAEDRAMPDTLAPQWRPLALVVDAARQVWR
jgi:hypothetical protein